MVTQGEGMKQSCLLPGMPTGQAVPRPAGMPGLAPAEQPLEGWVREAGKVYSEGIAKKFLPSRGKGISSAAWWEGEAIEV